MLKTLLLTVVCSISHFLSTQAQSLSLNNLLTMSNDGISGANDLLIAKGWLFKGEQHHSLSDVACNFPELQWAFAPSESDPDKASAYVTLFKTNDCVTYVMYQTFDKADYDGIRASIARYEMKHSDSKVVKDLSASRSGIRDTYEGANYVVEQIVSSSTESSGRLANEYYFTVHGKSN